MSLDLDQLENHAATRLIGTTLPSILPVTKSAHAANAVP
jgi:hypothetical protein